ncbi:MAG: hypothetical protein KF862_07430 [Chitinophagaceae bacterium]|nr:hypothetical protein [Chitinophagaceae bacterium]
MKLIYFTEKTIPKSTTRSGTAKVTFNKTGVISINQKACDKMLLSPGDKISIAQDEKVPENWYIFKDTNGFEVRGGYDKKGCLFNHSLLTQTVVDALGLPIDKTHGFLVAGKPTTVNGDKTQFWGLIAPVQ